MIKIGAWCDNIKILNKTANLEEFEIKIKEAMQ